MTTPLPAIMAPLTVLVPLALARPVLLVLLAIVS